MIRTTINAGVCGFHSMVTARSDDTQMVTLKIASECQNVRGLADSLKAPIDAYQEIGDGADGVVIKAAIAHLKGCCAGCVGPSGIFKSGPGGGRRRSARLLYHGTDGIWSGSEVRTVRGSF